MPQLSLGKLASELLGQHVQRILQEKAVHPVPVRMIPVQSQASIDFQNEMYSIMFRKTKQIHDLNSAELLEQQSETSINLLRDNNAHHVKELKDFEVRAVAQQSVYTVPLVVMQGQHEIERQAIIAKHAEHVFLEKSNAMKLLSQQTRDRIEVHSRYEIDTADKRRTDFVHTPTMSAPAALYPVNPAKTARQARPFSKGNGMVCTQSSIVRNDTYGKLANNIQDICGLPNFVLLSVPLCKFLACFYFARNSLFPKPAGTGESWLQPLQFVQIKHCFPFFNSPSYFKIPGLIQQNSDSGLIFLHSLDQLMLHYIQMFCMFMIFLYCPGYTKISGCFDINSGILECKFCTSKLCHGGNSPKRGHFHGYQAIPMCQASFFCLV